MHAKQPSTQGILWLKLDEESRQQLLATFPPKFETHFYDHVTLAYDVAYETVAAYIGHNAEITVYAYACNSQVEAVRVKTVGLPDTYGVPHITLSTKLGIQPFMAVDMLRHTHLEEPVAPAIVLSGQLEFITL